MHSLIILVALALATPALADSVFAQKTLRPKEVIASESVLIKDVDIRNAAQSLEEVLGLELKRAVYAGQPILRSNLTPAALVERNEVVSATFSLNGLTIDTEARALERGSSGDIIRAMNLSSRASIRAEILPDGRLKVLP